MLQAASVCIVTVQFSPSYSSSLVTENQYTCVAYNPFLASIISSKICINTHYNVSVSSVSRVGCQQHDTNDLLYSMK